MMGMIFVGRDSNPAVDVIGFVHRVWKHNLHLKMMRNKFRDTNLIKGLTPCKKIPVGRICSV